MLTDHFVSMLSTSAPMNLACLYNNDRSRRNASLDVIPETKGNAADLDDDDEDDYEPMNPGISTSDLSTWKEKRGGTESSEYNIPRPHNIKTESDVRPVRYASVVLAPRPNDHSSLLASPPAATVTITEITADSTEGNQGQEASRGMNNVRVVPKRWTRAMLEDDLAKQPIAANPKWAKPQNIENKGNSTQLNSNRPRMYAKTGMYILTTSLCTET